MKKTFFALMMSLVVMAFLISCKSDDGMPAETCSDGIQNNGETGVDCGGPNCTACEQGSNATELSGDVTEDTELDPSIQYTLTAAYVVKSGASLTIPAGTVIKATAGANAYIAVEKGGKIFINGVAGNPVVLTSGANTPSQGDWGGLLIAGDAPTNKGTNGSTEVDGLVYGGSTPTDQSGSITYLRVEYAGATLSSGISLYGVGSGTTFEHVESYKSASNGISFYGGTVDGNDLIAIGSGDNSIGFTNGWTGSGSNWYISGGANAGIAGSNNGDDGDATPVTTTTLSNITVVGPTGESGALLYSAGGGSFTIDNMYVSNSLIGINVLEADAAAAARIENGDLEITNIQFVDSPTGFAATSYTGANQSFYSQGTASGAGNGAATPSWAAGWSVGIVDTGIEAQDYHVGPGQPLANIADVPWATLVPGDRVFIHWRENPYKEKWVINRQGTASQRIEVIGVNGPDGQQPVIDGNGATTDDDVVFWNDERGVIKIGGTAVPEDGLPNYITIENLDVRSARPPYGFTDEDGVASSYTTLGAAIYVEKAANLIIRNCTLHDSGFGLFIGANSGNSQHILIEGNYIYDNGIEDSNYGHNTYTAAIDITYQYNHFGPLRTGAGGNNLKDRSAGLVVRYNWIEGGNRQLDMVDAEDTQVLVDHPSYRTTHVYGNVLIEEADSGNNQMILYGGDSGDKSIYRKGDLYFYNNTIISTRPDETTMLALSTNDETAHVFNNVFYGSAPGDHLALMSTEGAFDVHDNWFKTGWKDCHCSGINGSLNDYGNLTGSDPLFNDFNGQDFGPTPSSPLVGEGISIPTYLLPNNNVLNEYVKHQSSKERTVSGNLSIGAFE